MEMLQTPYFVIDEAVLQNYYDMLTGSLRENWNNYLVGYSFKTNSLPWLVSFVKKNGAFAEVVSEDEYLLARRLGYENREIIYNGPYKSESSFREVLLAGGYVNLDSRLEISWLTRLASEYPEQTFSVGIRANFDLEKMWENRLYMPDPKAAEEAEAFLAEAMARKDSVGGVAECVITGLPAGIGEPVFDKLDACLAKAVLSIGGVKGFEVGDGFRAAKALGSENNDPFRLDKAGRAETGTNHAGGILGGISDGAPVVFRAAIKPTPSIASVQQTVTRDGKEQELEIKGRHDPIIVPRAVVVVEAMAALTVADLLLTGMMSRMEWVHKIYGGPYEDRDGK